MKPLAPYQVFFPLGLLNAILAIGVWFVQNLGWFESPALLIHSKLIVGGFLWSFIAGFLMTAIPRMTGTTNAHKLEYAGASTLLAGLTLFSWSVDGRYFYAIQMALIVFLIIYGGRRILKMTKPLPIFFSHVGIAMVLAFLGALSHFQGNPYMGMHLYHLGATLLLVLGIGTRFFSFLSGLPSEFESTSSPAERWMFHGAGLSIAILLFIAGLGKPLAYLGLSIVSAIYLFRIWHVQRASTRLSPLTYGVRIVAAMIPMSFFMTWLNPLMFVTWFHMLFIGCFGLITFSVATRVTLAHGAYSTDIETQSSALWWLVVFIILGVVSRVLYGFTDGLWKTSCLHSAATFWILAVMSWCWAFLPRMFRLGPLAKPSC